MSRFDEQFEEKWYEMDWYDDENTYVDEERLKEKGEQWNVNDADTFVNTQETEQIEVTKQVNSIEEADKDTLFKFTVSELIDGTYQPAPHISYKVYKITDNIETAEPLREGITDLEDGNSNTGWGIFTLKDGEKAILDLPKDAYWQITEENTGKYKLVVDRLCEVEKKLLECFPECAEIYDEYQDAQINVTSLAARNEFAKGMRVGAQLILELIKPLK